MIQIRKLNQLVIMIKEIRVDYLLGLMTQLNHQVDMHGIINLEYWNL